MPLAFFQIIDAPADLGGRLEGLKSRLEELRGQVAGGAQEKLAEIRGRLDELVAQLPRPEHPIELPDAGSWVDRVKAKFDELRGQLPQGGAQGAVEAIRQRLDELKAGLGSPEHPIGPGSDFGGRLDDLRARLDALRGQVGGGNLQGQIDAVRARLEELRSRLGQRGGEASQPIHIPSLVEQLQGTFEALRGQLQGQAAAAGEEIRRRLADLKASLSSPEHPIELPQLGGRFEELRRRFEELRASVGDGALRARLDEIRPEVEGKALCVVLVPGEPPFYAVVNADAVRRYGRAAGPRPTPYR